MKIELTIIIAVLILYICYQDWKHKVKTPVGYEQNPQSIREWQDFIMNNINSCVHPEQCNQCIALIHLFRAYFKGRINEDFLNEVVNDMWNILDKKYRAVQKEYENSEITIDQLVN